MPEQPAQPLGTDDLTWSELADAVWLTSVTQYAWRDSGGVADGRAEPVEPAKLPTTPPGQPAPPTLPGTDVWVGLGAGARRPSSEMPHWPPNASDPVRPRTALALSRSADIIRALRPLKRKVASRHADEVVLDEDATADRAAQDGLWLPVTRPAIGRWLDLTLVVDASPSMALWRSTVTAVVSLAQRLGAFRSVQLRLLDTQRPEPVLRGGTPATPIRSPDECLDPSGRRILLVLTDGVDQCWRQGLIGPLLARWARGMPVAVVHLLPQRLWRRGGLELHRARLTVPGPMQPNRRWGLEFPDSWLDADPDAVLPVGGVPVPVLALQPRWLGWWARLVSGGCRQPSDATVLLAGGAPARQAGQRTPAASTSPPVGERVRRFLSTASPQAYRLATLLSAVPVSAPVAQLVQNELVPGSGPDHLVEVLTSGLLRPEATAPEQPAWDTATFEFVDTAREILLSGARRADTAHVVRLVNDHFGAQFSSLRHLPAALDDPDSTPDPQPAPDSARFVAIEQAVMQALSGPYLYRAARLHPKVCPPAPIFAERIPAMTDSGGEGNTTRLLPANPKSTEAGANLMNEGIATQSPVTYPGPLAKFPPVTPREKQPADVPAVWGNVPAQNPNFTGRAELLDRLGERLVAGGATVVLPQALHGMAGIGKTQMAVEYVYQHLGDYDVVWWIQATEPAQIRSSLTELAQRLDLPGGAEANTAVPAVKEALRLGNPYRNWLLVFDSAESPEIVRPFFPTNGPGQILVTSRNPDWADVARPLEVAVFHREESKELLRRRGPEIDDADADRLAAALGDLPLAIAQAAAWRAATGMRVDEYLHLFNEKVAEILDTSSPLDYPVSVAAAWNVAFEKLRADNLAAHQLLQVCAFFASEPISRALFEGVRGVTIAPELDEALRDPMQFNKAIREINRYGLAKIDHRNSTVQLHRLVQLVLMNLMSPQRKAEMSHGAHLLLANLDPNDPVPAKNWPKYQTVLPHVYAAKVIECDDSWARQLILNLMKFLYYFGDHEEAASLAQQAVDLWSEKLGEAELQTLRAARNLGFYLWTLGRYSEAAAVNKRTVELYRQVAGADSEDTILAELAVATDLKAQGDFIAALQLNDEIYQKAKGLFGDDDPTTLMTSHDLVVTLGLAGQYQKARELGEVVQRRRADVLGYENPSTFSTRNAVILSRREAGEYVWARDEQEKLAERSSVLLGAEKAATLRRFHNLAVARRKAGNHQAALDLSARVLNRLQVRYGNDHPVTMACAVAYSIDLRHGGRLEEARGLSEQIVERYTHNLGERHPHTLSALVDAAVTLRLRGDAGGARQLDERSYEQFRAVLGADHPYAIVSAINLASDLAALGETEAAMQLNTEALARSVRILGADHPTSLAALANLVLDLRTLGRTQEAETKYADVVTRYRKVLGESHPGTMAAVSGLRADCDIDPLPL